MRSSGPSTTAEVSGPPPVDSGAGQEGRYRAIRRTTEWLAQPLSPEDCTTQSMPDASPTKWHLGHTSWFFETFVLERELPGYEPFHPEFRVLFNSYYNTVGAQHARPERGLLTRPSLDEGSWRGSRSVRTTRTGPSPTRRR